MIGRKRATQVRKLGSAVIGKRAPAMNQGTIAIAGTLAMYLLPRQAARQGLRDAVHPDCEQHRCAERTTRTPAEPAWKSIPRRTAKAIRADDLKGGHQRARPPGCRAPATGAGPARRAAPAGRRSPGRRSRSARRTSCSTGSGARSSRQRRRTRSAPPVCRASLSAGAITSANRIGVIRGTNSSRGATRGQLADRRRESVAMEGQRVVMERLLSDQAAAARRPAVNRR